MMRFKKELVSVALSMLTFVIAAQEKVNIYGENINNADVNGYVYLQYTDQGKNYLDSTRIKNGKFDFHFRISEPSMITLLQFPSGITNAEFAMLPPENRKAVDGIKFYADKGDFRIEVDGDFSKSKVVTKSNFYNDEYRPLYAILTEGQTKIKALSSEFNNAPDAKKQDASYVEEMKQKEKAINDVMYNKRVKYVQEKVGKYSGILAMLQGLEYSVADAETFQKLFDQYPSSIKKTFMGQALAKKLDVILNLQVGKKAPAFSQKNLQGKEIKLSDYKGKYVLVDFWASRCVPCRKENPNLVAAYQKYNSKGFTILGVSVDENYMKWVEAIQSDKLEWEQVGDMRGFQNTVAKEYAVYYLPVNFLIDPNGIIIAKNLRGEALQTKLAELFGG